MKKLFTGIAVLLICGGIKAQYKKATFLNKEGRTYDLGTSQRIIGNGASRTGFYLSYGRDKGTSIFYWIELEVLLPGKFNYTTSGEYNSETAISVSGKTKTAFIYRYNIAYYLLKNERSELKFKPFVTAGLNFAFAKIDANSIVYTPANEAPAQLVIDDSYSYGVNAGAGVVYSFTEKVGLKITGGYNMQVPPPSFNSVKPFQPFKSHPYATLGIHFTLSSKND